LASYLVQVGSVVDLEAGVAYGSRTEAIEALGRDVVVPILHSRKKHKRLRVITMADKKQAMYEQAEGACDLAIVGLQLTVKDIELAMTGEGYTSAGLSDVASSLRALMEDLEDFISDIDEGSRYLSNHEYLETMRHEFRIEIQRDVSDMVSRL